MSALEPVDVVVIGAGIAGLTCALALSDHGMRVTVLERSAIAGGRASSWTDAPTGDRVDIGPHIFHCEYRNMLALLDRLGTRGLITWQPGKLLTIASKPRPLRLRHRPLPPPLSIVPSMLSAPGLSARDYLSMMRTGWNGMTFGEECVASLDREYALDYFRRQGVSERMIDWWWRFAAMVVTSVPLERCSAASLMRIHAQLSGYRGMHFGFAGVGLGDVYAPAAIAAIEAGGGRVWTNTTVEAITGEGCADGVRLAGGAQLRAAQVVSALPPMDLAQILPSSWRQAAPFDRLHAFEASPYVSCYLWFDRPLGVERFVSHLWTRERLNYDFYDLCQIRHGWQGRPTVIASNIIYSHRVHGMTDDDIIRATVAELAEFCPHSTQAALRHARVHRIPMAIPCPTPGFEQLRPASRTKWPGLVLAGDWMQTSLPCTMESAAKSGYMAAETVLQAAGKHVALALDARNYDGIAGAVRNGAVWWRKRRGA
ncbi:MAG: amine oxidase [Massilia sp.]|nr:amine oxidase [Massilia sp.]